MLKKILKIILMAIGGIGLGVVIAFLFGWLVMILWNWLMPTIFGLSTITFWQAWGLVILAHLLFKAGHHHEYDHDHNHDHNRWKEKFRAKFKEHFDEGEKSPAASDQQT
ncbi:hypothetical protein ISS37_08375 [candidate division KSB1 bacterium]|nr:hypothetical protein [candidate division KSB1 bacterium]